MCQGTSNGKMEENKLNPEALYTDMSRKCEERTIEEKQDRFKHSQFRPALSFSFLGHTHTQ